MKKRGTRRLLISLQRLGLSATGPDFVPSRTRPVSKPRVSNVFFQYTELFYRTEFKKKRQAGDQWMLLMLAITSSPSTVNSRRFERIVTSALTSRKVALGCTLPPRTLLWTCPLVLSLPRDSEIKLPGSPCFLDLLKPKPSWRVKKLMASSMFFLCNQPSKQYDRTHWTF